FSIWRQVGWQNEIRTTFGMPSVSFTVWPVIIGVAAVTAVVILIVSRSLRRLFAAVFGWLGRLLPPRLAKVLGAGALLLLIWLLITGLLVNGFFAVANTMFSTRDGATSPGIVQTTSTLRSGGPDSLVKWDELGRQGRSFVATGPTVAQLDAFSGGGAIEPIRAYVGLKSAETLQERADLLLAELKRTGAFDRKALVLTTTTGTGFLDPNGVNPVDYIFNGDNAIAGVQYSYLPSWISLLADQAAVKETSRVVFDTVHEYWSTLPEASRPQFYLYGLSLGSYGVESVLNSINIINAPIDGAFMSGPPFVNDLHTIVETGRDPSSPEWLPVYQNGTTVRFMNEEGFAVTAGEWGSTRVVYLQHGSDPVVFFSPSLAWDVPDWLSETPRAPDVAKEMGWFPLVTMWQVALDLPGAGNVPDGFGHMYSKQANALGWLAVTNPEGWTPAKTKDLITTLNAQTTTS
ncbi:MAG: alpha/beta hydrolase, partial [Actinomycetota bacterium]|nr:alpha/beta hydrolase [Actinomycetota bacterium]